MLYRYAVDVAYDCAQSIQSGLEYPAMSGWVGLLAMAALLGAGSFAIGMLPLSVQFSRKVVYLD